MAARTNAVTPHDDFLPRDVTPNVSCLRLLLVTKLSVKKVFGILSSGYAARRCTDRSVGTKTTQMKQVKKQNEQRRLVRKFLRCERKQPRQPEGSRTSSAAAFGRLHHRQNSSLTATTLNNERNSGTIAWGHKCVVQNVSLLLLFLEEKPTERAANPRVANADRRRKLSCGLQI